MPEHDPKQPEPIYVLEGGSHESLNFMLGTTVIPLTRLTIEVDQAAITSLPLQEQERIGRQLSDLGHITTRGSVLHQPESPLPRFYAMHETRERDVPVVTEETFRRFSLPHPAFEGQHNIQRQSSATKMWTMLGRKSLHNTTASSLVKFDWRNRLDHIPVSALDEIIDLTTPASSTTIRRQILCDLSAALHNDPSLDWDTPQPGQA